MSIRAMNWVWSLRLRPVPKLILLALADAADHAGVCWPSIPTIANLAAVSDRTVQRQIEYFRAIGLISTEPRFRKDGSRTSNRYRLNLEVRGGEMSPRVDVVDTSEVTAMPPGDGVSVIETTSEPDEMPNKPQPRFTSALDGSKAENVLSSSGELSIFPEELTPAELIACRRLIEGIDSVSAQLLLDELAGRLAAGGVRLSSVAYLRTLANRFHRNEFQPELALKVAERRRRKQETEERLRNTRWNQPPGKQNVDTSQPCSRTDVQKHLKAMRDALNGAQESQETSSFTENKVETG